MNDIETGQTIYNRSEHRDGVLRVKVTTGKVSLYLLGMVIGFQWNSFDGINDNIRIEMQSSSDISDMRICLFLNHMQI